MRAHLSQLIESEINKKYYKNVSLDPLSVGEMPDYIEWPLWAVLFCLVIKTLFSTVLPFENMGNK